MDSPEDPPQRFSPLSLLSALLGSLLIVGIVLVATSTPADQNIITPTSTELDHPEIDLAARVDRNCATTSSFDFVMLVLQWLPGQKKIDQSKVAQEFTIHGLWPSNDGENYRNYPCDCSTQVFRSNELGSSLTKSMDKYFPTSYPGNSFGFWSHEWKKHGTCAVGKLPGCSSVKDYFQTAINLREKVAVSEGLTKANIVPSNTQPYTANQILNAVKASTGVKPLLGCSYFGSGWTALSQVSFCYDNSLKLIECQYDVKNNRGGGVTNCDDNGSENIYIPSTAWANGNF